MNVGYPDSVAFAVSTTRDAVLITSNETLTFSALSRTTGIPFQTTTSPSCFERFVGGIHGLWL